MSEPIPLRFPPLQSVIQLDGVPDEVVDLVTRRWLAERGSGASGVPPFTLEWRLEDNAGEVGSEPGYAVRWVPSGETGRLQNDTGRVRLFPGGQRSRIEIEPDFARRPAGLESLLEAALGHALAARGECFLHAAAFTLGKRTPLLIGDSGAGKSTLTAAVIAHGGRAISDDSLLLGLDEGRPLVRTARRDLWLRPGSETLLPALESRGLSRSPATEGRIRLVRDSRPDAFANSAHPDCLVVLLRPSLDRPGREVRRLSQAEALAALLSGTSALYVTDARFEDRQRRLLGLMTTFAQELPAIELRCDRSLLEATEESLAAIIAALP